MPLLQVKDLRKYYKIPRGGLFSPPLTLKAADGISFSIERGETLGLVGESGCGKSTLARAVIRLEEPTSGEVLLNGKDLVKLHGAALRRERGRFQMIFQDPYSSLNPKMRISAILGEALKIHTELNSGQRAEEIDALLEMVGLPPETAERYPHQFSGGQRQRIGIARALAVNPDLIVADEPVSALDVSVQAQIINLLKDLQKKKNFGMLFIAHDIAVVEHISKRIMVMYLGKTVELAESRKLCAQPRHPYTKMLLSAVPSIVPRNESRIVPSGDVPSPLSPPEGCRFHPRCPFASERCRTEESHLLDIGGGHFTACHFPELLKADKK